ncbi:non-specific lipid transfer protein GPI-anchored 13-like isoform X2 [Phoenix dactylifera]|uniref:Non-specific lipid transfer protein GPI-anchored 13-like isoform X2 n=1 Tax=Phoenix dactylifera TaxID=42345 RepID=A0A8B7BFF5_PHODC|nr:non-specific lipid transfer protein GPI-anchored 13-like isoform X2 [Phoenix dactylifera]
MAGPSLSLRSSQLPYLLLLVILGLFSFASSDFASDRAECANQLTGLATCLTYVENRASTPTPDCCSGLKQVLATNRKCLCVLIKDRDEPGLGIKLNVTTAMALPSVCRASSNISECPKLLNLPPGSAEAQIFEQYGRSPPAADTKANAGASTSNEAGSASAQGNCHGGKKWLGVGKVGGMSSSFLLLVAYLLLGG